MNQKSKKHIVKSLAILFSVTALLTNANLLTSYAAPPTKNSQNESTDESCTKRPHDESTDEPQAKRPRNETTTSQSISKEKFFNAARNGRTETVELLLKEDELLLNHGANVNAKDNNGSTALMAAAYNGHTEIVKLLLKRGADINAKDNLGKTVLMAAAYNGHKETVEFLLKHGADIDAKGNFGSTALMAAAGKGHKEIVELLLNHGADVDAEEFWFRTAFMAAAENGHTETVKLLLEEGANIKAKDGCGRTALMLATYAGKAETVNLLLKHGADIDAVDRASNTAMTYAVEEGHSEIVKLLMRKRGAEFAELLNNETYKSGVRECIENFINRGEYNLLKTFAHLRRESINANKILECGDSSDSIDYLFKITTDKGYIDMIIAYYCDYLYISYHSEFPEGTKYKGKTLFMVAAERGRLNLVNQHKYINLVKEIFHNCYVNTDGFGYYVNSQDDKGRTALMYAIKCGIKDFAKYLITNFCVDLTIQDNEGHDVNYYAQRRGDYKNFMEWLKS